MAFVPVLLLIIAVLAVSIVGIPLIGTLPFMIAAAGVAGTAGFTAVAARIGARLRGTTVEASNALWVDVLIGMTVVSALTLFARFAAFGPFWTSPAAWSVSAMGFLIEYRRVDNRHRRRLCLAAGALERPATAPPAA